MAYSENLYLHGYSKKEQDRLYYQARLLEDYVYEDVDYSKCKRIIEVGSGVGAQTEILLERFPHLEIYCVDLANTQLRAAAKRLKKYMARGQVRLFQLNAEHLHTIDQTFDGALICWFLEHVPNPEKVLRSLKKILKPKAAVYFTEVHNGGFFLNPYSPNILKYWFEFNDFQWANGGNPFMGANLGNLLKSTGYKNIHVEVKSLFFDSRNPKEKNKFLLDFYDLIMSSQEHLKRDGRVTEKQIRGIKKEIKNLLKNKKAVYHLDYVQAKAQV
jgi:SAM-dependent methyltransferase